MEAVLPDGFTRPLTIACQRGYEKAARLLLENNADHTVVDGSGQSPLHVAAKAGKANVVEVR